jgi:hypothetical protein
MPTNRKYRSRRRTVPPISAPLLRFLCGEDFHAGIPVGELPADVLDFYYFDVNQRRREVYDAALPLMADRCQQLGRPVPSLKEILIKRGIPTEGVEDD